MNQQEKMVLVAVWKKAVNEAVVIDCGTERAAKALRLSLYRVAREMEVSDPELKTAAEKSSISFDGANREKLIIGASMRKELLVGLAKQLGIDPTGLKPEVEVKAEESLKRLQGKIGTSSAPRNPYYTRDDEGRRDPGEEI